jgi:hypothetical protein
MPETLIKYTSNELLMHALDILMNIVKMAVGKLM